MDLIERLRKADPKSAQRAVGSSILAEAADEIERLRALIADACGVFEHYDLPEHAFHYRRAVEQSPASIDSRVEMQNAELAAKLRVKP